MKGKFVTVIIINDCNFINKIFSVRYIFEMNADMGCCKKFLIYIYIYIYIYIKFFLLNGIFVFNQYTFALNHIFILSFKKHISSWWKYILYVICNLFLLLCNKNIIDQNIIFYPNKIFLVQSKIFFYTMLPFSDKTEKIWSFICM